MPGPQSSAPLHERLPTVGHSFPKDASDGGAGGGLLPPHATIHPNETSATDRTLRIRRDYIVSKVTITGR